MISKLFSRKWIIVYFVGYPRKIFSSVSASGTKPRPPRSRDSRPLLCSLGHNCKFDWRSIWMWKCCEKNQFFGNNCIQPLSFTQSCLEGGNHQQLLEYLGLTLLFPSVVTAVLLLWKALHNGTHITLSQTCHVVNQCQAEMNFSNSVLEKPDESKTLFISFSRPRCN